MMITSSHSSKGHDQQKSRITHLTLTSLDGHIFASHRPSRQLIRSTSIPTRVWRTIIHLCTFLSALSMMKCILLSSLCALLLHTFFAVYILSNQPQLFLDPQTPILTKSISAFSHLSFTFEEMIHDADRNKLKLFRRVTVV